MKPQPPHVLPTSSHTPDSIPTASATPPASDVSVAGVQYRYSTEFADLLWELGLTLLVATGSSGYVLTLSAGAQGLNISSAPFPNSLALAAFDGQLALALPGQILGFDWTEPRYGEVGPRSTWWWNFPSRSRVTPNASCADLTCDRTGLWALQSQSPAITVQAGSSETRVYWTPAECQAALNVTDHVFSGMALSGGVPRFLTGFPTSSMPNPDETDGASTTGFLIDIRYKQRLCSGLCSPHSPRMHRKRLWLLNSGRGNLAEFDLSSGKLRPFFDFPGFTRGLVLRDDYAFVGLSSHPDPALLANSTLTDSSAKPCCGIAIIHLPTGRCHSHLEFDAGVREVLSLELLQTSLPRAR